MVNMDNNRLKGITTYSWTGLKRDDLHMIKKGLAVVRESCIRDSYQREKSDNLILEINTALISDGGETYNRKTGGTLESDEEQGDEGDTDDSHGQIVPSTCPICKGLASKDISNDLITCQRCGFLVTLGTQITFDKKP